MLQMAQAQIPKLAKTNKKYTRELKHRMQGSEQKTELPHARKGSWLQLEPQDPRGNQQSGGHPKTFRGPPHSQKRTLLPSPHWELENRGSSQGRL